MQNYSLKRKTVVQKISASGALGCQLLKIIKFDVKNKVMQHLRNCKRQKKDEHLSKGECNRACHFGAETKTRRKNSKVRKLSNV
jgi:hypothetical protein